MEIDKKTTLFKLIINNIVIRKVIFEFVPDIHFKLNLRSYGYEKLKTRGHLLVEYGYLDLLKQHNPQEVQFTDISVYRSLTRLAARNGDIPIIGYLTEINWFFYGDEIKYAAANSHWNAVIHILTTRTDQFYNERVNLLDYLSKVSNVQLQSYDTKKKEAYNSISNLILSYQYLEIEDIFNTLNNASKCGNIDIIKQTFELQHLLLNSDENNPSTKLEAINNSISNGYIEIYEFLLQHRKEIPNYNSQLLLASSNGKFEIIEYILNKFNNKNSNNSIQVPINILKSAVKYNNLDIYNKYYSIIEENSYKQCLNEAMEAGNIDMVRYHRVELKQKGNSTSLLKAIEMGYIHVVEFCHLHHSDLFTKKSMDVAAQFGHLDILRFLNDNRKEGCTANAVPLAAINGEIQIIKYLHRNRKENFNPSIDIAASGGWLETVMYLYEKRKERPTSMAMTNAVKNGHYDVVKYLHGIRKEKSYHQHMTDAIVRNYYHIVTFIAEHSDRSNWYNPKMIEETARLGHIDILKYLDDFLSGKREFMWIGEDLADLGHLEVIHYLKGRISTSFFSYSSFGERMSELYHCVNSRDPFLHFGIFYKNASAIKMSIDLNYKRREEFNILERLGTDVFTNIAIYVLENNKEHKITQDFLTKVVYGERLSFYRMLKDKYLTNLKIEKPTQRSINLCKSEKLLLYLKELYGDDDELDFKQALDNFKKKSNTTTQTTPTTTSTTTSISNIENTSNNNNDEIPLSWDD